MPMSVQSQDTQETTAKVSGLHDNNILAIAWDPLGARRLAILDHKQILKYAPHFKYCNDTVHNQTLFLPIQPCWLPG